MAKFLENGFGALSKRELEVYLLHLLLEDGQFKNEIGLLDEKLITYWNDINAVYDELQNKTTLCQI